MFSWVLWCLAPKELHVNALQRYSYAALRDGLDNETIRDLASLASWGKHMSNCERDLHTMLPDLFGTKFPTYTIEIDMHDPDTATTKPILIPIMLASDVVHELWEKQSPTLWNVVIGCNATTAHAFWTAYRTSGSFVENHPVFQQISCIKWEFFYGILYVLFSNDLLYLTNVTFPNGPQKMISNHHVLQAKVRPPEWDISGFFDGTRNTVDSSTNPNKFWLWEYGNNSDVDSEFHFMLGKMVHRWRWIQHQPRASHLVMVCNHGFQHLVYQISFCCCPNEISAHQRASGKSQQVDHCSYCLGQFLNYLVIVFIW